MTLPTAPMLTTRHLLNLHDANDGKPLCLPALFISHGTPLLAIEQSATTNALARTGQNLPRPNAIVMMSAHWQSKHLEINSNPAPATWHDFSGFSKEIYKINYPIKGHPELAESLATQLNNHNIHTTLNPIRALDHGVWAPLIHLYPQADIPLIQLSLPYHYDAYSCYQLGALLSSLRKEQILLIGSGSITHNLSRIQWQTKKEDKTAKTFKSWLIRQLKTDISSALDWQSYPEVKQVHPTQEHLLPLFFSLGTGQRVSVIHESMAHHSIGMDIYRFD